MEIKGSIKSIGQSQTFGSFEKRAFVITTHEQYPQDIEIELHQGRVDIIDPYAVGEEIKVSINIKGKEWVSPDGVAKYFNTIVGWKIERL